ncbi:hypothetical protein V5799_016099 [Amblyomma americanum]|uniref:Uncharacterized protein n=1 Tax=Amblyomma americanum TaxID=6943 RepID=A0AAQ4F6S6_AMBAM
MLISVRTEKKFGRNQQLKRLLAKKPLWFNAKVPIPGLLTDNVPNLLISEPSVISLFIRSLWKATTS